MRLWPFRRRESSSATEAAATPAVTVPAPPSHPRAVGPADLVLAATVVVLIALGVVMVYSASAVYAERHFHNAQHFLVRQALFALVGIPLSVAVARFDYHRWRPLTYPILAVALSLLVVTALGFGRSVNGAARWIPVGPINIQPAELSKLALVLWLAHSLSKKQERIKSFSIGFLPHLLFAGVFVVLCLRQPDFGSAVMLVLLTFIMMFLAGARVGYILGAVLAALPVAYMLVTSAAYRMRRIHAWLDPFRYRQDIGYQISESLMSFGSGGVSGVGLGDGRQKLFFLPEAHTDFISAIIGEELGFIGITLVIVGFAIITVRGVRAAWKAHDDYGSLLAFGITMFIVAPAFVNLGVAMGLVPTKGLALPFLSAGGSALLSNCLAVGILFNVSRAREEADAPRPSRVATAPPRAASPAEPGLPAGAREAPG